MTPRDRRALRLGAGLAILSVIALRLVPWSVREVRTMSESLSGKREMLARARLELAELPSLEASAPRLRAQLVAVAPQVLSTTSPTAAAAALAGSLTHLAAEHRLWLKEVTPQEEVTTVGMLHRASVVASLEGDARGLAGLLAAMVTSPELLSPSRLRVIAAEGDPGARGMEKLTIQLEVRGWYLVGQDSTP